MIKFPNLANYISYHNNPNYKFGIRIDAKSDIKSRKRIESICFNVTFPISFSFLKNLLEQYCSERNIPVNIYEVDVNTDFETISFWKLIWFLSNIVEYKRVLISVEDPNDKHYSLQTSVYLNDEKDFNRLKEQINRFYDKDFDGLVD